ncbi:MAG: hypothetical protein ACFFD4_40035 [Candidatus Odinarchaeota archaeon]
MKTTTARFLSPEQMKVKNKTGGFIDIKDNSFVCLEGILYDIAFNVIHRFWNKNISWNFLKSTIENNWPKVNVIGSELQTTLIAIVYSAYAQLRKTRKDDVILDVQRNFTLYQQAKRLDCLLFRHNHYVIRDVKASVSGINPPKQYLIQLAEYALGAEKYRKLGENKVTVGELLVVDPFQLIVVNLTKAKEEIVRQVRNGTYF